MATLLPAEPGVAAPLRGSPDEGVDRRRLVQVRLVAASGTRTDVMHPGLKKETLLSDQASIL